MTNSRIQVLIVEDEELIREMMAIMVSEHYEVDIHEAEGAHQAIDIIKNHSIDLIISDLNMPNGRGDLIYQHNKDNKLIPFIFITSVDIYREATLEGYFNQEHHYYIPKPFTDDQVYAICDKIFADRNQNEVVDKPVHEDEEGKKGHASIPIQVAHHLTEEIGEIFIKINEEKFLKYLDQIEHGDMEKIEKLKNKGCKEIFVHNHKYEEWIQSRLNTIKENLKKQDSNPKTSDAALGSILQLSRVVFNVGSFPTTLVDEFEKSLDGIISNIWKDKDLKENLQDHLKDKELIQTHASVALFLCNIINKKINLNDQAKFKKLALACLFHEITITDENLVKIYSYEQAVTHLKSEAARETLFEHPDTAAEKLKPIALFDGDTLDIIRNHHELPQGKGFPRKQDLKKLKLLCRQFNVVHHISYNIALTGKFTKGDYFSTRDLFDDDEFLKYIDIIYDYFNDEA